MTDALKQLPQNVWCFRAVCQALLECVKLWSMVYHLCNSLLFFQWWLRGWCWEEWHTSLKTPMNMCSRLVQCKQHIDYTNTYANTFILTPAYFSKFSLFISSCFYPFLPPVSFFLYSITSYFCSFSFLLLSIVPCSSRWAGQMVLCYLLSELNRRWQSFCPRSGPWNYTFPDRNNFRLHSGSENSKRSSVLFIL